MITSGSLFFLFAVCPSHGPHGRFLPAQRRQPTTFWHSIASDTRAHDHTVGLAESRDGITWTDTGHVYRKGLESVA